MENLKSVFQTGYLSYTFPLLKVARKLIILSFLFIAVSCSEDSSTPPVLNTLVAQDSDITTTTATLKGEFTSVGNMKIVEYGIEISTSQLFTPSQTSSIQGNPAPGEFQVQFTDLDPNTLYYYKAYALVNTANVYSENREQFTTKQ